MVKIACPKYNSKKLYQMSSGKRRCSECKYDFILHKLPMRLARAEWKRIIRFFLMEQSSNSIIERTQFERRHVFRALTKIRIVLAKDVPEIFSGTVEVDETYLGGQWKNKRKTIRDEGTKRGRGTRKQPVFGTSVAMVRSGPRLSKTQELILFNLLSHKKFQQVLLFVLIPGKLIPGSLHEDMFIVSSIMVNVSTPMEKEITSMVWKDSGDI